jgi:hypothetical protein
LTHDEKPAAAVDILHIQANAFAPSLPAGKDGARTTPMATPANGFGRLNGSVGHLREAPGSTIVVAADEPANSRL